MSNANQHPHQPYSLPASVDMPWRRIITANASGQTALNGAGAPGAIGISDNEDGGRGICKAGRPNRYFWSGVHPVEAGGAIAVGANITSDAQGRAVTAATGNFVYGKALKAASGAGFYIELQCNFPGGFVSP